MAQAFAKIAQIDPKHQSTWAENLFLTFDLDWAHDTVIEDTMALVADAGVAATWFATHPTPLIDRLAEVKEWETGIHPNFNKLLSGDPSNGTTDQDVVSRLLEIVPHAKSVRSHSMLQSTRVLDLFQRSGLTHDVNQFIPSGAGITLKPWRLWNGMTRVPYVWEDDMHCMYGHTDQVETEPSLLAQDRSIGLRVFDFHPIHVFLNTESLDRYENTRALHRTPDELIHHRYDGFGTRSRLIELLAQAKAS